jgi:dienelactone hydrolase
MHQLERRLAARDTERRPYDFDWGLEHLDPSPPPERDPARALLQWARDVVETPARFYVDPGAPPFVEEKGDDRVRFPSAVRMPHASANWASLRLFTSRQPTQRAMLVLPQWNADAESHVGLCRMLAERGITAARLTLPYHEERSPHESIRADMAVSANIGRTLRVSQQAVSDVRRARAWLEQRGHDRIGIVGTSLGSCIGFLALAQEPAFKVGVLHHVSSYFGDVVWRGISTRHVRAELEAHCSQAAVRRFWAPISPIHFVGQVSRRTHTLLLTGRYDLTFPYDLSQRFHRAFRQYGLPHRVIVVPWGHYTSGVFPFNAITVHRVLRYLDEYL